MCTPTPILVKELLKEDLPESVGSIIVEECSNQQEHFVKSKKLYAFIKLLKGSEDIDSFAEFVDKEPEFLRSVVKVLVVFHMTLYDDSLNWELTEENDKIVFESVKRLKKLIMRLDDLHFFRTQKSYEEAQLWTSLKGYLLSGELPDCKHSSLIKRFIPYQRNLFIYHNTENKIFLLHEVFDMIMSIGKIIEVDVNDHLKIVEVLDNTNQKMFVWTETKVPSYV